MTRCSAHCAELSAAVDVPVSADLENCFADEPLGVAETIHRAIGQGLAGGSVEDFTRNGDDPIYELGLATDRVRAAAEAAHNGPVPFVLTARAENYLHDRVDLADTIARLQAYQEAGADVLFAPRVVDPDELRTLLAAVDRPVSVLLTPGAPPISALAALGVGADLGRRCHRGRGVRHGDRSRQAAPDRRHPQLLGGRRRSARRHRSRLRQALTATVTSISTAPRRGSAATPIAERVWRPASPKTSASTRLAPSTTVGCSWKSGAEAT